MERKISILKNQKNQGYDKKSNNYPKSLPNPSKFLADKEKNC